MIIIEYSYNLFSSFILAKGMFTTVKQNSAIFSIHNKGNNNNMYIYDWRNLKWSGGVYQSSRWSTPRQAFVGRIMKMTTTPSSIGPSFEKLTKPFHETRFSLWVWRNIIPCLQPKFSWFINFNYNNLVVITNTIEGVSGVWHITRMWLYSMTFIMCESVSVLVLRRNQHDSII
jgi:hypothetical protein